RRFGQSAAGLQPDHFGRQFERPLAESGGRPQQPYFSGRPQSDRSRGQDSDHLFVEPRSSAATALATRTRYLIHRKWREASDVRRGYQPGNSGEGAQRDEYQWDSSIPGLYQYHHGADGGEQQLSFAADAHRSPLRQQPHVQRQLYFQQGDHRYGQ